jgi:hypothetical protein
MPNGFGAKIASLSDFAQLQIAVFEPKFVEQSCSCSRANRGDLHEVANTSEIKISATAI